MARNYARKGPYRMTSARRAALRKAQLESARKRKRNRRIKIAAGAAVGAAALGGAAWAGYKHGGKVSDIAKDMRSRTPKSVSGAAARVRAAVQPAATQATRMRNGLTKGFHNGAGPNAGQNAPKPRVYRRTEIPAITAKEAQALQDKAQGVVREKRKNGRGKTIIGTKKLGPADRQKYNEDGTVQSKVRGIPYALVNGRKIRSNKFSAAMERHQKERSKLLPGNGIYAQTEAEMATAYKQLMKGSKNRAADPISGRYRNESQRRNAKKRAHERRARNAKKRAEQDQKIRDLAWNQWLKDNPNG